MPAPSELPAVKSALVTALAAALPDVLVRYGLPGELPADRERVYVIRAEDIRVAPATRSHGPARWTGELLVVVEVHASGRDPVRAEEQAGAIIEVVAEAAEAADLPSGWSAQLSGLDEDDVAPLPDGWLARTFVRLALNRLTVT